MTVRGGACRSGTTLTRSLLAATASTLHQLSGGPVSSAVEEGDGSAEALTVYDPNRRAPDLRGVFTSSQQGPFTFLLSRKCSRLEVLVPNTWEKVAPFRSEGSEGNSAYETNRMSDPNVGTAGPSAPVRVCGSQSIALPGSRTDSARRGFQTRSSSPLSARREPKLNTTGYFY